ncbi:MAG: hypothetical protein MPJ24_04725 [Pirellulaceae bacterium]|nr:hypothetical protein [Pirellulaceae bacterium]
MNHVELLAVLLAAIKSLGYQVREEELDENCHGICSFGSQKYLFLDSRMSPEEKVEHALESMGQLSEEEQKALPPKVRRLLSGG